MLNVGIGPTIRIPTIFVFDKPMHLWQRNFQRAACNKILSSALIKQLNIKNNNHIKH